MKNLKQKILLILLISSVIHPIKAQDKEITGKDLSFLIGQTRLQCKFSYEGLTINGDPEEEYLKKQVTKMNGNYGHEGTDFLNHWKDEKQNNIPNSFIQLFNDWTENCNFEADTIKEKYYCVIHLLSIKTGLHGMVTPTLWVSYTFYENGKPDIPLAFIKSHVAYANKSTEMGAQHTIWVTTMGSWDKVADAYMSEAGKMARLIKKAAQLKKVKPSPVK